MYSIKSIKQDYKDEYALINVCNYICRDCAEQYQGGMNISAYPVIEMKALKEQYNATGGNQLFHIILLFSRKYGFTAEMAYRFTLLVIEELKQYQFYYGLHTDTKCPHVHFMINSIAMNGERLNLAAVENHIGSVCKSVMEKVKNNSHILYH